MTDRSRPPPPDIAVPAAVRRLAGTDPIRPVWANEIGGLTFALAADRYVKWTPSGSADLAAERDRLRWAGRFTPVPRVLDFGRDPNGEWLVTAALPGCSAVDDRWQADPRPVVTAIGAGLRALHDALPVTGCPFDWSVPARRATARPDPRLEKPPPVDRLVVCHGDACAPNTIVDTAGQWVGHVDLGCLGVADRWADLAIATWSTQWNYGPGWEDALLAAYGVAPDEARTRYYRLLWDLGP